MSDHQPELIIFAGTNGSGKTAHAINYLKHEQEISNEFLNADEIAKGLSPVEPETQRVQAGKILLQRMENNISAQKSFALETTLSGITYVKRIKKAKENGFNIIMFYFWTDDPQVNLKRIENRIREGGHNITEEDVLRRYTRSTEMLAKHYWSLCDIIFLFNNREGYNKLICMKDPDNNTHRVDEDITQRDEILFKRLMEINNDIKI